MATYTPFIERNVDKIAGAIQQKQQGDLSSSAYMGDQGALEQLYGVNPALAERITMKRQQDEQRKLAQQAQQQKMQQTKQKDVVALAKQAVEGGMDINEASSWIQQQAASMGYQDIPPLTEEAFGQFKKAFSGQGLGATSESRTRSELLKDLKSEDAQVSQSAAVALGLEPRAMGSAAQTIASQGTAEDVADVEATIAERRKFAELSGASRSKKIDSGFDAIENIDKNVLNLDRAINEIDKGASTGAIEKKFLPSLRASTIALENIQGSLALDVIGSVTFGALSQGELDLARDIAMPTGLQPQELKKELQRRKTAQQKLRDYYQEQIDFLDQGGTVAGFLRKKRRESEGAAQSEAGPEGDSTQSSQVSDQDLLNKYGIQ